jgi:chemotaxis protein CheD
MNRCLLDHPDLGRRFLHIAEGEVFMRPTVVSTVLGSCVSVTFFCPTHRIGGIFHALLPEKEAYAEPGRPYPPYRYVDTATDQIARRMQANGAQLSTLECKVFGGGSTMLQGELGVGRDNAAAALDALGRLGLTPCASDVGRPVARKLFFVTHTGEVFIRRFQYGPNQACD